MNVPEGWRVTNHPTMGTTARDGCNGYFDLPSCEPGWRLAIICSDGRHGDVVGELAEWEHVSVHAYRNKGQPQRTPTWKEMSYVKGLFWDDETVVMQLHPRRSEYVNNHPHVLHLWRPKTTPIPTPPAILVGVLE